MLSLSMPILSYLLLAFLFFSNAYSATRADFSQYRVGFNNRGLFQILIDDLVREFEQKVNVAYGEGLQAKADKIVIDEDLMDKYLGEVESPKEREAIARFILAHEYFHVALKHTQTDAYGKTPREIQILGKYVDARKQMERQVDYLAAKYLYKLELPTQPVQQMLLKHPEFHGGEEYPTAQERAELITQAKENGIEKSHFDNTVMKCTFLLSSLITKFH